MREDHLLATGYLGTARRWPRLGQGARFLDDSLGWLGQGQAMASQ